ncbi:AAA family ATPase [Pradoshia sp. D12]|uniref:deoxynucleoside kinase n=1 Tax=Bacillaceae TaxID=186817 RepID=UPI00080AE013|nr:MULTISPECIES: deoxynucleoside kinase [Bacillaceae]OCA88387.1 deoxyguanosine kinase [Bacillus sp. FJAT-27986]QFK69811.1 AAA family ATPase [Pradoshia sp. D12]
MNHTPFITVEGPIGVGKTSLAKAIASHFQYKLLKEIVDENPFLDKFYDDIQEWSFQTEMFFLCNRYKQLEDIQVKYIQNNQPVVADYHIFKNLIFAQRTIQESQFSKYKDIYSILTMDMPRPNMVIYLDASIETLMHRIALRGREFEKNISEKYLMQLSEDYAQFMNEFEAAHPDIPVLRFNGDEMDFILRKEDLDLILTSVSNQLQKGVCS